MSADETAAQLLDEHTALLEYKVCGERSYAWVVTPDNVSVAELPGREKIRELVSRFIKARDGKDTIDADEVYWKAARDLSEAVIAPVAEKLSARRLLLVGDDALQQVSFGGLPWPTELRTGPAPLIEHFSEITNIPSASSLAAMRALPRLEQPPKLIAIIAEPRYAPDRPSLVATGPEALKVARLVPPGSALVISGGRVNPAAIENAHLENFRHILFATHGIVDTKRPDLSGVVLSEIGAHGKPQDGILRLLDIYRLQLRSDLVFLAACQGADGKPLPGEGLLALSRGFMYSGARAVIATMWRVHDAPTARLMGDFYRRLLDARKVSAASALRDTQLALWREKQSPRKWAAFVIMGDTK